MTMTILAHDSSYEIEATGIVAKCAEEGNPYEARLLEHIYKQEFDGLALDVGAHVGNHTLWLAAVCGLDVVAFEPGKSVKQLRLNVELNGLQDRVSVHRVALGEAAGVGRLVGKGQVETEAWHSMTQEIELGKGEVVVKALDEFELNSVAVMKVDVEGMEANVLRGGLATIERCRPAIYAETWGKEYTTAVREVLEPLGYRRRSTIPTATPVEEWIAG